MDSKARKMETNLIVLGAGVIAFGAMIFIKLALNYLIYGVEIGEDTSAAEKPIIIGMMWFVALIIFLFCFYIGQSARAEGKGKKKSFVYIIMAVVYAFINVLGILLDVIILVTVNSDMFNTIVVVLIDTTSLIMIIQLIVNAVGIRRLRKKEATA